METGDRRQDGEKVRSANEHTFANGLIKSLVNLLSQEASSKAISASIDYR
jgi:hypothetical protein